MTDRKRILMNQVVVIPIVRIDALGIFDPIHALRISHSDHHVGIEVADLERHVDIATERRTDDPDTRTDDPELNAFVLLGRRLRGDQVRAEKSD